ncbi:DUF3999 family protein [Uliginosibacterium sp. sgz301328]|uniref:DUF3999 family protein n=1 Tax=Uliginosibacterium sp. sgz301328 TaxID=3243764 RepID=UPI00359E7C86
MLKRLLSPVLLAMCALSTAAGAADVPLAPQDFANGLRIEGVDAGSALYRLELPQQLYGSTAWPDLRDVRVFNSQGQAVPFWLDKPAAQPAQESRVALRLFAVPTTARPGQEDTIVVQTGQRRVEVTLPDGSTGSKVDGQTYLLELPESGTRPQLTRIHLAWRAAKENWRGHVTVFGSNDLRDWDRVASSPLADLKAGNDSLRVDDVDLNCQCDWRYWMLRLDAAAPELVEATGIHSQAAQIERPALLLQSRIVSPTEMEYIMPRPAMPVALRVRLLQPNSVAPMEISVRPDSATPWRTVSSSVIYRLNSGGAEQVSPDVPLNQTTQAIRLVARGAGWDGAPMVYAVFEPRELVFNARGSGPFILAWGARAATDASLPEQERAFAGLAEPMMASLGAAVTLGGPERLTAESPAERAAAWQKFTLWGVLVAGALALAWLAISLLREARNKPQ